MTATTTRPTLEAIADVSALLRSRAPLIWVVTTEEARAEAGLIEAARDAIYFPRFWDISSGITDISGNEDREFPAPGPYDTNKPDPKDPRGLFDLIRERAVREPAPGAKADRNVFILRDVAPWVTPPVGIVQERQLKNLVRLLPRTGRSSAQSIIVISSDPVPAALRTHAKVVDWPLPDRIEIGEALDGAVTSARRLYQDLDAAAVREGAIDAALGLTLNEARSAFAKSLVRHKRIDVAEIVREKRQIILREGLLEWVDPLKGGLNSVGGLEVLKGWLRTRETAWTPEARAYGLPSPKGALLVGVPGAGKSLTAKAVATAWQVPLIKVDLGALKSKFVGESEANLRRAFRTIEAMGRVVVWFDELEKALAGASQGAADGGVSSDALGALLGWMQDRRSEAFVFATANDVSKLPPELLRKGRWDELFWVDLPTRTERCGVLRATLASYDRAEIAVDEQAVAVATNGFTGAEIAALVPEAMFAAFADKARVITTADLLAAAENTVPLSLTAADKIKALREWGAQNARPASLPEEAAALALDDNQIDL